MSAKPLGTVSDWTAFLGVRPAELDETMTALQRAAIDTSLELQHFLRRIRGAPNEEMHLQGRQLSSVMGLVVMEIGVTRRSLFREVNR